MKTDYVDGLVSVIIPSYNRGKYLNQTIDSVLDQTYPSVELFVVDDGSTDDSLEIARSYGDRLSVLQHDGGTNKGQSASINLGLDAANGEYIAILDSDDYWMLDKLEKQVAFFRTRPDIGLVYGNYLMVDADGNRLFRNFPDGYSDPSDTEAVLLDCYLPLPSNALVRRSAYADAGGLDESLRAAQDHDMLIRLAEVCQFAYIDDLMFSYRRHADSISAGNALRRWKNGFKILANAQRRFPYSKRTIRKRKAVLHFRLAQCLIREKRFLSAANNLCRSFVFDPSRSLRVVAGREQISSPNS